MLSKKMIVSGLAVIVAISSFFVKAQTRPDDSNAHSHVWEKMDDSAKVGYILGFSNASETYQMVIRYEKEGCGDVSREHLNDFLEQNPISLSHTTLMQWKDEVDHFYKEPLNREISPMFAMQIVSLKFAGRSQEAIDKQVESMRRLSVLH